MARHSRSKYELLFLCCLITPKSSGKTQIEVHLHQLVPGKWLGKKTGICMFAAAHLLRGTSFERGVTGAKPDRCNIVAPLKSQSLAGGEFRVYFRLLGFKRVDVSLMYEVQMYLLKGNFMNIQREQRKKVTEQSPLVSVTSCTVLLDLFNCLMFFNYSDVLIILTGLFATTINYLFCRVVHLLTSQEHC